MKRLFAIGLAVSLCWVLSGVTSAATLRTVALGGDFPAGTPNALPVSGVFGGLISDSGVVTFLTEEPHVPVVDPFDTLLRRVWLEDPNGPILIVSENDTTPILPGDIVIDEIIFAESNDVGQVMLNAFLSGPGVETGNNIAAFLAEAGSLELVARQGDPVPNFPDDVVFTGVGIFEHGINNLGNVVIRGNLAGPGINTSNDSALFLSEPGTLRRIIQDGDPAPFMSPGMNVLQASPAGAASPGFGRPHNNSGQLGLDVVLNEQFMTDDGAIGDRSAIYVEDSGAFHLVAQQGGQAPGLPTGVEFVGLESFGIDAAGRVAFKATLEGPGVVPPSPFGVGGNGQALYIGSDDAPSLVFRLGDEAPGTDPNVVFSSLGAWALGVGGDVALAAGLSGPGAVSANNAGIWAGQGDGLELVVRRGSPAPGTEAGVVFENFELGPVGSTGQVSLVGFLTGDGVDSTNNFGIWATDPDGTLQLIIRKGDELEVAPGIFRTLQSASIGATNLDNEANPKSPFSSRGDIVFSTFFTDGSTGVFVSDRVAIPEPSTLVLVLAALCLPFSRRRKRAEVCIPPSVA